MIRKLLLAVVLALATTSAWGQNIQCPDRPTNDDSNACANTRFVNKEIATKAEFVYPTVTALIAATVPTTANGVQVLGYLALGDGGRAQYSRSVAPAGNGKVQSADGAWWLLNEPEPNELMFGAVATASNSAQTTAIQAMLDYCVITVCSKAKLIRVHTTTATIVVPGGIEFAFENGLNFVGVTGYLIKGFNGDMMTIAGAGTILRNPFLNGVGASFTGRGIVVTGDQARVYSPVILDTDGAAIDFPTGGSGIAFTLYDGSFSRHTFGLPQITFPTAEVLTTGYRRFFNSVSADGGTLFKFNNGNQTQVNGGASGTLDYSATTTGRVSVINHRCGGAVTIFGTEGHFEGNTCGVTVTLGAGTSLYSVANNVIASGEVVDSSGTTSNRLGVTVPNPGLNNQVPFGQTGGQALFRTVNSNVLQTAAPTATTFCTSPSISANNGAAAFTINVGTGCATSVGTVTLPAATTGWACDFQNVTAPASNVIGLTGGSTTTVTLTNYARTTGLASNWTDSNIIRAKCSAY